MTLTPQQHTVAAELFSRATRLNCHEEAVLVIESITALVEQGERGMDILKWLSLLPRARGKQALRVRETQHQLSLITVEGLHPRVVHALRPVSGQDKTRSVSSLMNPDTAGRPTTGTCGVCGDVFVMNPTGRPATKCEQHRRSNPRKASA